MSLLLDSHPRMRWAALLVFAASLLLAVWLHTVTLPSLFADPNVPRTRIGLVLGCVSAASAVIFLRSVLPEHEKLGVPRWWQRRLPLVVVCVVPVALVAIASASLIEATTSPMRSLAACLALTGLGIALSALSVFVGLAVPWIYTIAGMGFGYESTLEGPAELQPWAWMVSEWARPTPGFVIFAAGLAIFVLTPPPRWFVRDRT